MGSNILDMGLIVDKLKERRKIFVSEADFQLELAWTIKENYPNAKIRLEYCPTFDLNMHIDILVIMNNKWYPIELKYKTKGCKKIIDDEIFVSDLEHDQENILPNKKTINSANKHDIIYTTDEDNNLIRKVLTRDKKNDDSK